MIEKLLHLDGVVQLVGVFLGMMRLSPILEEYGLFSRSPEGQVEFDTLIPGNGFVLVAMHQDQGGFDPVGIEEG